MITEQQINLAKDFAAVFGVVSLVFVVAIAAIFLFRRFRVLKHIITAIAIMLVSIFIAINIDTLPNNTGAYAVIYAAALGTLGWIFTLYETRSNQRRDFTLRFIKSINESAVIDTHKLNVSQRFPYSVNVNEADVDAMFHELKSPGSYSSDKTPILYSIVQILNHYEFIAIQLRANRIDEQATKEWYKNLIVAGVKKFAPVIRRFRNPQNDQHVDAYPALMWLYKRWTGTAFIE